MGACVHGIGAILMALYSSWPALSAGLPAHKYTAELLVVSQGLETQSTDAPQPVQHIVGYFVNGAVLFVS